MRPPIQVNSIDDIKKIAQQQKQQYSDFNNATGGGGAAIPVQSMDDIKAIAEQQKAMKSGPSSYLVPGSSFDGENLLPDPTAVKAPDNEEDQPGWFENFSNRFQISMDQVQKSMGQELLNKAMDSRESGFNKKVADLVGVDNLKSFVDRQDKEMAEEEKHTYEAGKFFSKPSNWLTKDINAVSGYISNELPTLLGSSAGLLGAGAAGGAVGWLTSGLNPVGAFAGAAIGVSAGRYTESLAEAGDSYNQIVNSLTQINQVRKQKGLATLSADEIHQRAMRGSDEVFQKNMALLLMDVPAMILSFGMPGLGTALEETLSYTAGRYGAAKAAAEMAGTMAIEGSEEGLQFMFQQQADAKAQGKQYDLSTMWGDKQFRESVLGGVVLGGLMHGAGHVFHSASDAWKGISDKKLVPQMLKDTKENVIQDMVSRGRGHEMMGWLDKWAANPKTATMFSQATNEEQRMTEAAEAVAKHKEDIKERINIWDGLESISDEDMRKQAYRNQLVINENDTWLKKYGTMSALSEETADRTKLSIVAAAVNKNIEQHNLAKGKEEKKAALDEIKKGMELLVLETNGFRAKHATAKTEGTSVADVVEKPVEKTEESPKKASKKKKAKEKAVAEPEPVVEQDPTAVEDPAEIKTPQTTMGSALEKALGPINVEDLEITAKRDQEAAERKKRGFDDHMSRIVGEERELTDHKKGDETHLDNADDIEKSLGVTESNRSKQDISFVTGDNGETATVKEGILSQSESAVTIKKDGTEKTERRQNKAIKAYDFQDKNGNKYVVAYQEPYRFVPKDKKEAYNKAFAEEGADAAAKHEVLGGSMYLIPVKEDGTVDRRNVQMFYASKRDNSRKTFLYHDFENIKDTLGLEPVEHEQVAPEKKEAVSKPAEKAEKTEKKQVKKAEKKEDKSTEETAPEKSKAPSIPRTIKNDAKKFEHVLNRLAAGEPMYGTAKYQAGSYRVEFENGSDIWFASSANMNIDGIKEGDTVNLIPVFPQEGDPNVEVIKGKPMFVFEDGKTYPGMIKGYVNGREIGNMQATDYKAANKAKAAVKKQLNDDANKIADTFEKEQVNPDSALSKIKEAIARDKELLSKKRGNLNNIFQAAGDSLIAGRLLANQALEFALEKLFPKILRSTRDIRAAIKKCEQYIKKTIGQSFPDLVEESLDKFREAIGVASGRSDNGSYKLSNGINSDAIQLTKDMGEELSVKYNDDSKRMEIEKSVGRMIKAIDFPYVLLMHHLIPFSKTVKNTDNLVEAYTGSDSALSEDVKNAIKAANIPETQMRTIHAFVAASHVEEYEYMKISHDGTIMTDVSNKVTSNKALSESFAVRFRKVEDQLSEKNAEGKTRYERILARWNDNRIKLDQSLKNKATSIRAQTSDTLNLFFENHPGAAKLLKAPKNVLKGYSYDNLNKVEQELRSLQIKAKGAINAGEVADEQINKINVLLHLKSLMIQEQNNVKSDLYSSAEEIVANDVKAIVALTGISEEQAEAVLNQSFLSRQATQYKKDSTIKTFDSYTDFLSSNGFSKLYGINGAFIVLFQKEQYRGQTTAGVNPIEQINWTDPEMFKRYYIDGHNGLLGTSFMSRAVINDVADQNLSHRFFTVAGKRQDAVRFLSHMKKAANEIGQFADDEHFINNNYVQDYKESGAKLKWVDGISNDQMNKAVDKGKMPLIDKAFYQFDQFSKSKSVGNKKEYYQVLEQLGDKDHFVMTAVRHYGIKDANREFTSRMSSIFGYDPNEVSGKEAIEKEKKALVDEVKKYIQTIQRVHKTSYPMFTATFAEEFALNYAINKIDTDQYYQDMNLGKENAAFKSYEKMVKRAGPLASPGMPPVLGLENGMRDTHRVVFIDDPQIQAMIAGKDYASFKKKKDGADGFILESEDFNNRREVSYGTGFMINGIGKAMYSKNDTTVGGRVVIKGNGIVLTKEFAQKHGIGGEKGLLMQLYNYMQKHNIDRLVFTSSAKAAPESIVNRVGSDTGLEYVYDKNGEAASLKGLDKHVPVVYNAESASYMLQQDLGVDSGFRRDDMPIQLYRQLMALKSYRKIEDLMHGIMVHNSMKLDELMSNLKSGNVADMQAWKNAMLDIIPDTPENSLIISLLQNEDVSRYNPVLLDMEDKLLSSVMTKTLYEKTVNRQRAVEAPAIGVELKGISKQGNKVVHPECLISSDLQGQVVERDGKKFVLFIRVPTTGPHSITIAEVKGFLPYEMRNTIITDRGTQFKAGSDNDGDVRHIISKFKERNGKALAPEQVLSNQVWDAIFDEWSDAENYDYLNEPIDTDAFGSALAEAESQKGIKPISIDKLRSYSFSDVLTMSLFNADGKQGIGMAANTRAFFQYSKQFAINMKQEIFNILGQDYESEETISPREYREIEKDLANVSNVVVDNANLQLMERMGLTTDTINAWMGLRAFYGVPVAKIIQYFRSDMAQYYINRMRESKSAFSAPINIWEEMLGIANGDPLTLYDAQKLGSKASAKVQAVVEFNRVMEMGKSIANTISTLKNTEDGVSDFSEYMRVVDGVNQLASGTKGIQSSSIFGVQATEKEALENNDSVVRYGDALVKRGTESKTFAPMVKMLDVMKEYYRHSIVGMQVFNDLFQELNNIGRYYVSGKMRMSNDQVSEFERFAKDYVYQRALKIKSSVEELTAKANEIYETDIKGTKLEGFLVQKNKELGIAPEYMGSTPTIGEINEFREAFSKLGKKQRMELAQYHLMKYGFNMSTRNGGFMVLFDDNTHEIISKAIENTANDLARSNVNVEPRFDEVLPAYPNLIPMASNDLSLRPFNGKMKLYVQDEAAEHSYPSYLKKYDTAKKRVVIYKLVDGVVGRDGIYEELAVLDKNSKKRIVISGSESVESKVKPEEKQLTLKEYAEKYIAYFTSTNEVLRKSELTVFDHFINLLKKGIMKYAIFDTSDLKNKQYIPFINQLKENGFEQVKEKPWIFSKGGIDPVKEYETSIGNNSKINYQLIDGLEEATPESEDPELREYIRKRLAKAFPNVESFSSRDAFEKYVQHHFPGEVVNTEAIGAAVETAAVFIDEKKAVQDTRVHEYAHIYWDMLPSNDPIIKALTKFFGSEENAIETIGRMGTEMANKSLRGSIYERIAETLKTFWSKVRRAIGVWNSQDAARIFASDMWKGASLLSEAGRSSQRAKINYQFAKRSSFTSQDKSGRAMKEYADNVDFSESRDVQVKFDKGGDVRQQVERWKQTVGKGAVINREYNNKDGIHIIEATIPHNYEVNGVSYFSASAYRTLSNASKFLFNNVKEKEEVDSSDTLDSDYRAKNIGTPLHNLIYYVMGQNMDRKKAIRTVREDSTHSLLDVDDDTLHSFLDDVEEKLNDIAEEHGMKLEDMLKVHEQPIYSKKYQFAGTADVILFDKKGHAIIVDFKTSDKSTKGTAYSSSRGSRASKEETHFYQLAQYASCLEEAKDGIESIPVAGMYIMPIKYNFDETDNKITALRVEDEIPFTWDSNAAKDVSETVLEPGREIMNDVGVTDSKITILSPLDYARVTGAEDAQLVERMTALETKYKAMQYEKKLQNLKNIRQLIGQPGMMTKEEYAYWNRDTDQGEIDRSKYNEFLKQYKKYVENANKLNQIMNETNWSKLSMYELSLKYNEIRKGYDNAAYSAIMEPLMNRIVALMALQQGKELDPNEQDLDKASILLRAPSDFTTEFPAMQSFMKDYYETMREMSSEYQEIMAKANTLMADVISKHRERMGLGFFGKAKDYLISGFVDDSQYFEDFWEKDKDGKYTGRYVDPKKLKYPEQRAYLEYVMEHINKDWITNPVTGVLASSRGRLRDESYGLHVNRSLIETYHNAGFYAAFKQWCGSNKRIEEVRISRVNPMRPKINPQTGKKEAELMTLANYLKELELAHKTKKINVLQHSAMISNAVSHAKKRFAEKTHDDINGNAGERFGQDELAMEYKMIDGSIMLDPSSNPGRRSIQMDGSLKSVWHTVSKNPTDFSLNIHRGFNQFMQDMLFEGYMQGKVPSSTGLARQPLLMKLLSLQAYYQTHKSNDRKNENTQQYIQHFLEGRVLGEKPKGQLNLGESVDNTADKLFNWTFYANMAFNVPMSIMNVGVGMLNNFIFFKHSEFFPGIARYFKGYTNGVNAKIFNKFKIVAYDEQLEAYPTLGSHFTRLSMYLVEKGEEFIQGSMFLGSLSDEEYNNIAKNIDDESVAREELLSNERLSKITKRITDVQGKYWAQDKRNYSLFALYRLVGQFKTWLPDTIRMWVKKEETNMYGQTSKGVLNTFAGHFKNLYQDIVDNGMKETVSGRMKSGKDFLTNKEVRNAWLESDDADTINTRRELKALTIFGTLFGAYALFHGGDDDEDKTIAKEVMSLIRQLGTIFDVTNYVAWASAPAAETISKMMLFVKALALGETYKTNSIWGYRGELKVFDKAIQMVPYSHGIQVLDYTFHKSGITEGVGLEPIKNYDYGKNHRRKRVHND